jgi:drug/metabolite transporter (DMT)-like permease
VTEKRSQHFGGTGSGFLAALLFGASAPLAKLLLPGVGPLMLAGLLYLGAGLGLTAVLLLRPRGGRETPLRRGDWGMLLGIIVVGGMIGPILMLVGLGRVSALAGSLLLNLEAPFTIVLAVVLFREHLGGRAAAGAAVIVAGAAALGYRPGELRVDWLGVAAIAGACLAWAVDNNLTQRLSLRDPVAVTRAKTLGAGSLTLAIALATGGTLPPPRLLLPALLVGTIGYGVSIALHTYALRLIGAARQAAIFATAPFAGAALAIPLLGDRPGWPDWIAAATMLTGTLLLVRATHSHVHRHEALVHEHVHVHDEHHRHTHEGPVTEPHAHPHRHEPIEHEHPHVSEAHHRHEH